MAFKHILPSSGEALQLDKADLTYPFNKIHKDFQPWGWGGLRIPDEEGWIIDEERNLLAVSFGCVMPRYALSTMPWWRLMLIKYKQVSLKVVYYSKGVYEGGG